MLRRYTRTPFSVIALLFDVAVVLLGIRFFFTLLGANAGHWFVQAIYRMTQPLISPFEGMFPDASVTRVAGEWATIAALIVYAILGMLLLWVLSLIGRGIEFNEEQAERAWRHRRHVHEHSHA